MRQTPFFPYHSTSLGMIAVVPTCYILTVRCPVSLIIIDRAYRMVIAYIPSPKMKAELLEACAK